MRILLAVLFIASEAFALPQEPSSSQSGTAIFEDKQSFHTSQQSVYPVALHTHLSTNYNTVAWQSFIGFLSFGIIAGIAFLSAVVVVFVMDRMQGKKGGKEDRRKGVEMRGWDAMGAGIGKPTKAKVRGSS
jgi:hypothetical protein